ncbi:protein expanded isoform X2 [Condylostylus longicornis]|uniref:protein expanded isoform X2 n=1 Tax=Condylostylus longicornis TaxID=2530218 RepID=UPI00244E3FFA|nr:protein expanded isoform X2 [Condylostylus longicornis]
MRTFCTVSAPLEACAPPARPLSPGSRFLALRLLGTPQPRTLYFLVEAKSRVREVYSQTCLHFAKQGMLDTELFGLAVLIDGEYMFADPESKLSKYGPKSWRSSHTHGLDANGRPLLELHFRVQFYIESPFMLRDETSRHNYYLQLKANAISRDVPKEYSEQSMILLGGLALQADLGDCPDDDCRPVAESPAILSSSSSSVGASSNSVGGILINGGISLANLKNQSTVSNGGSITSINATIGNISLKSGSKKSNTNIKCNTISDVLQLKSSTNSTVTTGTSSLRKIMNSGSVRQIESILIPPASSTSSLATNSSTSAITSSSSSSIGASNISSNLQEYFRLEDYLPAGIHSAWSSSAMRSCHRENRGISRAEAELNYIRQACSIHDAINAHVYRMKLSKTENGIGTVLFVVYAKGIRIYSENAQPVTFLWPNITKLSFERKKFEIRSGDNKITLYSMSDEKNKMLLTLCKETHQFSMKIASRLKEAIRREEEENQCLDACYIYSRSSLHLPYKNKNDQRISVISSTSSNTTSGIVSDRVHSEDELEIMINTPPNVPIAAPSTESLALAHLLDRPSVSRQASSAGQVSLKDLEEHLAALSIRSKTRSNSSDSTGGAVGSTSGSSTEHTSTTTNNIHITDRIRSGPTLGDSSGSISIETESPNSHHNIGSQCSSTCSTVVVATDTITLSSLAAHTAASNRRSSTSSSLELGFSHTAQNSAISEDASTCVEHEFRNQDGCEIDETQSGVYTLEHGAPPTETSGVYTMNSSEITGQSSEIAESESHDSSHYGCFQPNANITTDVDEGVSETADSVDGLRNVSFEHNRLKNDDMSEFRLRSDSNISASGSFRGDGSDPTDNKHTLLTAEELTDLIVGRGSYPSRKTVSATLDSDCDYVTLPLALEGDSYIQGHQDTAPSEDADVDMMDVILPTDPPAPPKRIDSNMPHSSLANIGSHLRSPPPYHARHETTGLCGPSVRKSLQKLAISSPINKNSTEIQKPVISQPPIPIPLRDPPPYPQQPTAIKSQVSDVLRNLEISQNTITNTTIPEEVTARFITTRPHINILKAHTSVVSDNAKPSFAAPTLPAIIPLGTTSNPNQKISQVTQVSRGHSNHNVNSLTPSKPQSLASQQQITATVPTTIGIPIVPYNIHSAHKSISSIPAPPPPYHHEVKPATPRTCVLLPVIKPRQYLPPPPPTLPRQPPPPPPPPQLATVYTGQLARSQIELYQQQLYSDVDYVIYPLQDPAVSQQEYLDAKQGSILAAMAAQSPPPPPYLAYHTTAATANTWDTCKGHAIYRSTPYLPIALSSHSRYASTQNLSDTYVQLPGAYSPLYSPSVASLCSSYEPPPPPPLRPTPQTTSAAHHTASLFARSRSDDNILNSVDGMPKIKRHPPPPPPPYVNRRVKKPPMPVPIEKPPPTSTSSLTLLSTSSSSSSAILINGSPTISLNSSSTNLQQAATNHLSTPSIQQNQSNGTATSIDIQTLREKSKNMDLPLISALCNDRSLLKQTKAFVMPKHPKNTLTISPNSLSSKTIQSTKYPVSGLSTTQLAKPRKTTISHRHPNDKLPPLPMQTAEANNYVMDPTPSVIKHKSYNSTQTGS